MTMHAFERIFKRLYSLNDFPRIKRFEKWFSKKKKKKKKKKPKKYKKEKFPKNIIKQK